MIRRRSPSLCIVLARRRLLVSAWRWCCGGDRYLVFAPASRPSSLRPRQFLQVLMQPCAGHLAKFQGFRQQQLFECIMNCCASIDEPASWRIRAAIGNRCDKPSSCGGQGQRRQKSIHDSSPRLRLRAAQRHVPRRSASGCKTLATSTIHRRGALYSADAAPVAFTTSKVR